jgi:hypothetical protein
MRSPGADATGGCEVGYRPHGQLGGYQNPDSTWVEG